VYLAPFFIFFLKKVVFDRFIFYIKCNGLTLISALQLPRQTPIYLLLFIIILIIRNP